MLKEIIIRIKSETPKFFKKLRKSAFAIGGSCIAIITLNSSLGLDLNSTFISVVGYIIVTCGAIAGTATLAKQD